MANWYSIDLIEARRESRTRNEAREGGTTGNEALNAGATSGGVITR